MPCLRHGSFCFGRQLPTRSASASWHIVYNSKCNTIQSEEAIFFGSNSRLGTVWSFPNCVAPRRLFELRRATMKGLLANISLVYFLYVRKSTDVEDKRFCNTWCYTLCTKLGLCLKRISYALLSVAQVLERNPVAGFLAWFHPCSYKTHRSSPGHLLLQILPEVYPSVFHHRRNI